MKANSQNSKSYAKQIGKGVGLAAKVATAVGTLGTAHATGQISEGQGRIAEGLDAVSDSQTEIASGLNELADAEVIGSTIQAVGDVLSVDTVCEFVSGIIEGVFS